jgi:hypothetical protein
VNAGVLGNMYPTSQTCVLVSKSGSGILRTVDNYSKQL